jgi:hypothetical protein
MMEFLLVKKWLILVLLQKFLIPVLATSDIRSRKSLVVATWDICSEKSAPEE